MTDDAAPSHPVFARLYDAATRLGEPAVLREHREYLTRDLDGAVLDLGAGTGALFPYLRDAPGRPGTTLHAIEPDPHMRRRAERRAASIGLDVAIRDARAESLPYPDDSFDVVIAALVFCTIPDVDAALREVHRVLRPGGEFRFVEHVRGEGVRGRVQDVLNPAWRRCAAGCNLDRRTDAVLRETGLFSVAELERFDAGPPLVRPFVRGVATPAETE